MAEVLSPAYRFGSFRLEPRERLLSKDGAQVHLTPRTFDALLRLVSRAGSVVTREELLADVWAGVVVEEGNLSNTIWILRRAIGEAAIQTVPKVGYRFVTAVERVEESFPLQGTDRAVLVVLPFRMLPGEAPEPALEQGLADLLISRLSAIPELVVRPLRVGLRASEADDPVTAARAGGAEIVVEGSLQRANDQVRANARLHRSSGSGTVWAETVIVPWGSIFSVEDALAASIAEKLVPELGSGPRPRLAAKTASDSGTYELYLQGRFHMERRTTSSLDRAIGLFGQAIEGDSAFAPAWAGIAEVQCVLPMSNDRRPSDCMALARAAIERALEINADLAEALSAAGLYAFWYGWDWNASERSFRRALASNPSLLQARLFYAHMLSNTGRHAEAQSQIVSARAIDPASILLQSIQAMLHVQAGRSDEALRGFDFILESAPDFWHSRLLRGKLLERAGRFEEARADLERARELSGGLAQSISSLALLAARRGDAVEAARYRDELEARRRERWVPPTDLVIARLACGVEDALDGLELAYAERDPRLTFLAVDPKWDEVASDPRVIEMKERLRLPRSTPAVA